MLTKFKYIIFWQIDICVCVMCDVNCILFAAHAQASQFRFINHKTAGVTNYKLGSINTVGNGNWDVAQITSTKIAEQIAMLMSISIQFGKFKHPQCLQNNGQYKEMCPKKVNDSKWMVLIA